MLGLGLGSPVLNEPVEGWDGSVRPNPTPNPTPGPAPAAEEEEEEDDERPPKLPLLCFDRALLCNSVQGVEEGWVYMRGGDV